MSLPKSVKFKKDGVVYENNVDKIKYTMHELARAALRGSLFAEAVAGRLKSAQVSWLRIHSIGC